MMRRWTTSIFVAMVVLGVTSWVLASGAPQGAAITTLPDFEAACATQNPYLFVSCYRGLLKTAHNRPFDYDAPSVLMFNDNQNDYPHYEMANFRQIGAVWGLGYAAKTKMLYAAAYHKRQVPFGPGPDAPGAIWQVNLNSGSVSRFATVPNAGPDTHDRNIWGEDDRATYGAGKTSLGDLDLSEDESTLFVTNLFDRKIYRYDVATGALLGSFDHGAAGTTWARDARPFGLKVKGTELYHAVVNSAEVSRDRTQLAAYVYRSAFDGSGMSEIARFPLTAKRDMIHFGADRTMHPTDWQVWSDQYSIDRRQETTPYLTYPMPMATDIELDIQNNLFLGLHDRVLDTGPQLARYVFTENFPFSDDPLTIGVGDLLYAHSTGTTWDTSKASTFFQSESMFLGGPGSLGGLAYINTGGADMLAAGATGTQAKFAKELPREGVVYYNATGAALTSTDDNGQKREEVCAAEAELKPFAMREPTLAPVAYAHNGEIPIDWPTSTPGVTPVPRDIHSAGLVGDIEIACPRTAGALPTPAPTATPKATAPPPAVGAQACDYVRRRVPAAVLAAALARSLPNVGCNLSLPVGPMNPPRRWISLQNPSQAYHPIYNGLVFKCGCP